MKRRNFLKFAGLCGISVISGGCESLFDKKQIAVKGINCRPNIVLIYADDLGYGDFSCYGAEKVSTPNVDELAAGGVRFTDAHSASAVCTPSRYGLLTGRYPWRLNKPNDVNVWSRDPLLLDTDQPTIASVLQSQGYKTACIGKWHLGFGEVRPDWNSELKPGPLEVGFDHYFGIPVSNNWPPFVYVEDYHVVGKKEDEDIRVLNFLSTQPNPPKRKPENIGMKLKDKSVEFIEKNSGKPFFLYLPTSNTHRPLTPHPKFKGTSDAGIYGDFVKEFDYIVKEVVNALKREGVFENTLIIVTSDNGAREADDSYNGHEPNGKWKGQKGDAYEGGHRVPFIAHWPGVTPADEVCDQMVCQTDMGATFCSILGVDKPDKMIDSLDISPLFSNPRMERPLRETMVVQASRDIRVTRKGAWKLIPILGSAGFSEPAVIEEKAEGPHGQLYNLEADPKEENNLWLKRQDKVRELEKLYENIEEKKE